MLSDYFSLVFSSLPPFVPRLSFLNLSSPILVSRHFFIFFFSSLCISIPPLVCPRFTHMQKHYIKNDGMYFAYFAPFLLPLFSSLFLIVRLHTSTLLPHSQVSWMQTGNSRPGRGEELLERKEAERESVASLSYQQQLPCQSQPQAPPLPLPLPHHPPQDGGGGGRGRGRWQWWMLQQQYQEREGHHSFLLPVTPSFTLLLLKLQRRRIIAAKAYTDKRLLSPAAALAQAPSPALDSSLLPWSLYPPRDRR